MIIDHQNKFVFVHNPKTAGTSIKHWFFENGPSLLLKGAKGEFFPVFSEFPDHYGCGQLDTVEFISDYHKAATVRNTWDRVVSMWRFKTDKNLISKSFEDSVRQAMNLFNNPNRKRRFPRFFIAPPQHFYTHIKGEEQWVDQIMHFDSLKKDWEKLQENIGVDPSPLPHSNKSKTKKPSEWNEELVEMVSVIYAKDISLFGCIPPELK